jgi:hypothetical protein
VACRRRPSSTCCSSATRRRARRPPPRLLDHLRGQARALGIACIAIVAHPPAEAFYLRMGAERIGTRPPAGRVTWSRPLLSLPVG